MTGHLFQVGTLVSNAMDFYSDGRSKAKMSKKHFVDDLIEDQDYKKVRLHLFICFLDC